MAELEATLPFQKAVSKKIIDTTIRATKVDLDETRL